MWRSSPPAVRNERRTDGLGLGYTCEAGAYKNRYNTTKMSLGGGLKRVGSGVGSIGMNQFATIVQHSSGS